MTAITTLRLRCLLVHLRRYLKLHKLHIVVSLFNLNILLRHHNLAHVFRFFVFKLPFNRIQLPSIVFMLFHCSLSSSLYCITPVLFEVLNKAICCFYGLSASSWVHIGVSISKSPSSNIFRVLFAHCVHIPLCKICRIDSCFGSLSANAVEQRVI